MNKSTDVTMKRGVIGAPNLRRCDSGYVGQRIEYRRLANADAHLFYQMFDDVLGFERAGPFKQCQ